jgi:hypothetical protein
MKNSTRTHEISMKTAVAWLSVCLTSTHWSTLSATQEKHSAGRPSFCSLFLESGTRIAWSIGAQVLSTLELPNLPCEIGKVVGRSRRRIYRRDSNEEPGEQKAAC